jgi:hypothetical protein
MPNGLPPNAIKTATSVTMQGIASKLPADTLAAALAPVAGVARYAF